MTTALLTLLLAIVPLDAVIRESCAVIEVNNFHDESAHLVFAQLIFWETRGERLHVRDWRLIKTEQQVPRKEHDTGCYVVRWQDGESGMREVRSRSFVETWTQQGYEGDRETNEREVLPVDQRRKLRGIVNGNR